MATGSILWADSAQPQTKALIEEIKAHGLDITHQEALREEPALFREGAVSPYVFGLANIRAVLFG